jgi:hypothetical protein
MAQAYQRSNFGTLGQKATNKLQNDNDIKIIIQGQNSQTGIGKTTLAIQLCRYIDNGWSAEDKAFVDVQKYIDAHLEYEPGSALLLDEIEAGADNRRAMSQENVDLSQAWATLRARNIATVTTLPSISMLDGRMLELADYWILVKQRGYAQPFEIRVNDFKPKRLPSRQPLPGDEHIQFVDLPDGDPDKQYLDKIKDEMLKGEDSLEKLPKSEHKRKLEKAKEKTREQAERDKRNEAIKELYRQTDLSTTDLASFEWTEVDQSNISRIINNDK